MTSTTPSPPEVVMLTGRPTSDGYLIDVISHGETKMITVPWDAHGEIDPVALSAKALLGVYGAITLMEEYEDRPIALFYQCLNLECVEWHAIGGKELIEGVINVTGETPHIPFQTYD